MIRLGDTNDEFSVVQDGLAAGDKVILNPLAFVDQAQTLAIQPTDRSIKSDAKRSDSTQVSIRK